jgi:hypothetical protein
MVESPIGSVCIYKVPFFFFFLRRLDKRNFGLVHTKLVGERSQEEQHLVFVALLKLLRTYHSIHTPKIANITNNCVVRCALVIFDSSSFDLIKSSKQC